MVGLVAVSLVAGVAARAQAVSDLMVTNLQSLRLAVQAEGRRRCHLDFRAEVCAVDRASGLVALRDSTGAEVCDWEFNFPGIFPGEDVHFVLADCELIRRPGVVAVVEPPLVDLAGIHSARKKSGGIHLTNGLQPIDLFYFNAKDPAELEVDWSGPRFTNQPVPPSALFMDPADAPGMVGEPAGLKYFCYIETPATLDEARHEKPSASGTATNFDIGLRKPEEFVAMQFRGNLAVPQTGDYVFTVVSDDGSELYVGGLCPQIVALATNIPPKPRPPVVWSEAAMPDAGEWTTMAGRVSFAGFEGDGLDLDVVAGDHVIRLWVPNSRALCPALLLNSEVAATGVLHPLVGPGDQKFFGTMSVVGDHNITIREIAAEQWEKYPLTPIAKAVPTDTGNFIAHLSGRITRTGTDGSCLLTDDSASIKLNPIDLDQVANGAAIEVLGDRVCHGKQVEIEAAFCRPLPLTPAVLPTLTTASQVQQLTVSAAARGYPVHVRGVITGQMDWLGAVVQDDTRGVFFNFDSSYLDDLRVGDFVDIQGVTAAGDFAPVIAASQIQVLGQGQMPAPARPNWNQLISGSLDSQYAEIRGIITAATNNVVTLLTDGGKINVEVHDSDPESLRRLENTLVRIRGCLLAQWDPETRQVRVGEIKFRSSVIEVDQLPPAEPFSAPAKTIADLLRFDLHASGFQRVKVSGQVVHVSEDVTFLMEDGRGLRFRAAPAERLEPGDLVDVVGIPDVSGPSPLLHEAVVRKTGAAPLTEPLPWPDPTNSAVSPEALLVRTDARLIGLHHAGAEWVLELQTGLRTYQALLSTLENLADSFPLDSRLRLTGVYATPDQSPNRGLGAFELLLNSPADIQLLQRPPWWNLRRLLFIVAALLAVLAAAALWITQLRRKVEQRTLLLEREHTRRERAERERALEFERSRIARDLHDDLGSSLTEIRVMASTGLRAQVADKRSSTLFHSISQKAHNLVSALDVIVWAVDPEANSLQSLADYLSSYAGDYLASAGITSRFRIPVALPVATLDGRTRHELFLAVKETLHNIVQHSRASEVEFHLHVEKRVLEITIIDNGCGFDLDAVTEAGHGLRNIPERLARLGGRGELKSRPGEGTSVRICLALPAIKEA